MGMIAWFDRWMRRLRERDLQRHFNKLNPETITDIDKYLRDHRLMS